MEPPMDRTEAIAKLVVESVAAGAQLTHNPSQSHGEHDFDIVLPGGGRGLLEVTRATEESQRAMQGALRSSRHGGPFVPVNRCQSGWYVILGGKPDLKRIRRQIDGYLADIELEGRTRFFAPADSPDSCALERIWANLGVEAGAQTSGSKVPQSACPARVSEENCVQPRSHKQSRQLLKGRTI